MQNSSESDTNDDGRDEYSWASWASKILFGGVVADVFSRFQNFGRKKDNPIRTHRNWSACVPIDEIVNSDKKTTGRREILSATYRLFDIPCTNTTQTSAKLVPVGPVLIKGPSDLEEDDASKYR